MTREEWDKLMTVSDPAKQTPLTPERFVALLNEVDALNELEPAGSVNHYSSNCSKCKSGEHYLNVTEQEIKEIQELADFVGERNKK